MILSELSRNVTEWLEELGNRGIFGPQAQIGARETYFCQPGSNRRLSGNECGSSSRTALLSIPVGEERTFFCNAIDVRRAITHDAKVIGANVQPPDVVAPNDQNVWFLCRHDQVGPFGLACLDLSYRLCKRV